MPKTDHHWTLMFFIVVLALGLSVSVGQLEGRLLSWPALRIVTAGSALLLVAFSHPFWIWPARAYLMILLLGSTLVLGGLLLRYIAGKGEHTAWITAVITALEWSIAFILLQWKPARRGRSPEIPVT